MAQPYGDQASNKAVEGLRAEPLALPYAALGPIIEVAFPFAAVPRDVPHGLGQVPDGYHVLLESLGVLTAVDVAQWTRDIAFLQASANNTRARVLFFTVRQGALVGTVMAESGSAAVIGEGGAAGSRGPLTMDGTSLYDFGGSLTEFVQSPTPTWVSANARQISIDGGSGGGLCTLTVRIRAISGTVTARLRDVTNNVTAGQSAAVAAPNYGTQVIAVTLSAGVATYEVQLLPSVANEDVNLGSAYLE